MDDKRFDHLTRLIGKGASRRSILKGLLGIGGAAVTGSVITDEATARTIGSRPTIPPPPPPVCPSGQQQCGGTGSAFCCPYGKCNTAATPDVCCDGAGETFCGTGCCANACTNTGVCCAPGQDACRSICCAAGTCGRSGNTDVCCADPSLRTTSGECCETALQRCDTDCCPEETVCLTRVFDEGPFVEEETCCPFAQTCDNRCCAGECFDPGMIVNDSVLPLQVDQFEQTCCPPEGTVCPGANGTFCCQGDTPQCCVRQNGDAFCIADGACCLDEDCDALDDPENCLEGVCTDAFACAAQTVCGLDEICCVGGDDVCCPTIGEGAQECCGPECCALGFECCERTVDGVLLQTCIDPATQCCTNPDCFAPPFNFDQGCVACPPTGPNANTCQVRNEGETCGDGECSACYQGQCIESDEACTGEGEICCEGACRVAECCISSDCEECGFCDGGSCFPCGGEGGGVCCDGVCNLESECCDDQHCVELLANVDPGCVICYQGECMVLGDSSGGPACDFDTGAGICCHGECIAATTTCSDCMDFGESCFGALPCCEGLFCDPLLDFTCIRRCEVCDASGTECVPADDETFCLLDDFTSGICCSGECVPGAACATTTTTAAPTTTTAVPVTTTLPPTTTTQPPGCTPACSTGSVCCDGMCQTCCAGTGIGCEEFVNSICCFGEYCRTAGNICCRIDGDCPTGSVCCGGTCDVGECCTGIEDDFGCDPEICCPGANGNECVPGPDCPAPTTTTTAAPACDPVTCADLSFCFPNGVWRGFTCIANSCSSLPDQTCSDGNPCTLDLCDDATGCDNTAVADGPAPAPATGVCCGGTNFPIGQCCGTDASLCVNHGFDDECVACESGNCVPATDETDCVLEDQSAGTCCDGVCLAQASCTTTTTTAATGNDHRRTSDHHRRATGHDDCRAAMRSSRVRGE